jgi:hypothetical protein
MKQTIIYGLLVIGCHFLLPITAQVTEETSNSATPANEEFVMAFLALHDERVAKCGAALIDSLRVTCDLFENYFEKETGFTEYLRMIDQEERKKHGKQIQTHPWCITYINSYVHMYTHTHTHTDVFTSVFHRRRQIISQTLAFHRRNDKAEVQVQILFV